MMMNSVWNLRKMTWSRENAYLSGNPCGTQTPIRRSNLTNKKQYPDKKEKHLYFLSGETCTKTKYICSWVLEVCRAKCALRTQYLNLSLNSASRFSGSRSHGMNTKQQINLLVPLRSYSYLCKYSSYSWFTPGTLKHERHYSLYRNALILLFVVQTACCWTRPTRADFHQVTVWLCAFPQCSSLFIAHTSILFVNTRTLF